MRKVLYGIIFYSLIFTTSVMAYQYRYYGPTFANEHLWRIAMIIRPNRSVSLQQVMLAILDSNPRAFNEDNVNGLKSGYKLRIPSLAMIQKISSLDAEQAITEQNEMWEKGDAYEKPSARHQYAVKDTHKKSAQAKNDPPAKKKHSSKVLVAAKVPVTHVTPPKTSVLDIAKQVEQHSVQSAPNSNNQSTIASLKNDPKSVTNKSSSDPKNTMTPLNDPMPTAATNTIPTPNIVAFMQDNQNFQRIVSQKLANLERRNKLLEAKINQLDDEFKTVTYHFIKNNAKKANAPYWQKILENLREHLVPLLASLLVLTLLLLLLKRSRRSKISNAQTIKKDDYDYMGKSDSIPQKLDLARAYIDMGDNKAAKASLREVIAKGSADQRKEAQDLLSKINR